MDFFNDEEQWMDIERKENTIGGLRHRFGYQIIHSAVVVANEQYVPVNPAENLTIHLRISPILWRIKQNFG